MSLMLQFDEFDEIKERKKENERERAAGDHRAVYSMFPIIAAVKLICKKKIIRLKQFKNQI